MRLQDRSTEVEFNLDLAHTCYERGTLTQDTPLAAYVLEEEIRYEMFGKWTAPSEAASKDVDAEVQRRFKALPLFADLAYSTLIGK